MKYLGAKERNRLLTKVESVKHFLEAIEKVANTKDVELPDSFVDALTRLGGEVSHIRISAALRGLQRSFETTPERS